MWVAQRGRLQEFRKGIFIRLSRLWGRQETLDGPWRTDRTYTSSYNSRFLHMAICQKEPPETLQCHRLEMKAIVVLVKRCWVHIFTSWLHGPGDASYTGFEGHSFKVSFLLPENMLLTSWEGLTDDGQQLSYEPVVPILTIYIFYEYMYKCTCTAGYFPHKAIFKPFLYKPLAHKSF